MADLQNVLEQITWWQHRLENLGLMETTSLEDMSSCLSSTGRNLSFLPREGRGTLSSFLGLRMSVCTVGTLLCVLASPCLAG